MMPGMKRFEEQDFTDAEFRECDMTRARLIGVVLQDVVIDGLVSNLVVNGVEVASYVEAELDRRFPVRLLIRSADPVDLGQAHRQLQAGWGRTVERIGEMMSKVDFTHAGQRVAAIGSRGRCEWYIRHDPAIEQPFQHLGGVGV